MRTDLVLILSLIAYYYAHCILFKIAYDSLGCIPKLIDCHNLGWGQDEEEKDHERAEEAGGASEIHRRLY